MADHAEPGSRKLGRPPKITQEQILEAALTEGFAGLSVPAVAERLGVNAATVYRHVATRADLLRMLWEHVLNDHDWPRYDLPWRELLRQHATAIWDLLADHHGAVTELAAVAVSPRMAALYDDLAAALLTQGFSRFDAILAADAVVDLAIDHRRGIENLSQHAEDDDTTMLREQVTGLWMPDGTGSPQRQHVRAEMRAAIQLPPRDWFGHKLDLVLDGLTTRYSTTKA